MEKAGVHGAWRALAPEERRGAPVWEAERTWTGPRGWREVAKRTVMAMGKHEERLGKCE